VAVYRDADLGRWEIIDAQLDAIWRNRIRFVYGARIGSRAEPRDDSLDLLDEVAVPTAEPDAQLAELRQRYEADDRLRMDGSVINVARGKSETVS
jgi:hypothetical protein